MDQGYKEVIPLSHCRDQCLLTQVATLTYKLLCAVIAENGKSEQMNPQCYQVYLSWTMARVNQWQFCQFVKTVAKAVFLALLILPPP